MNSQPKKIPWWKPEIGKSELPYIQEALENHFPNEGPLTEKFQDKICQLLGCQYAVAVTSGTIAIYLSLKALNIGPGDEVLVPDLTFIATANAVQMTGANPVLVDIDPKTLTICTTAMEQAITTKTKAIIPVHVSGRAANMEKINEIAKDNNLFVVEDSAEAFLSKHKGKFLGTHGITGCFSFSPHKTITTGQGGMIVTNDSVIYQRLKELKDQGRPKRGTGGDDFHHVIGYNFKFTDLQAGVGLGQLNYLEDRTQNMKRIYKQYRDKLQNLSELVFPGFDLDGGETPQWTDVLLDDRDDLESYLKSRGIDCRKFWFPLHTQKPYQLEDSHFPNSTTQSKKALWLSSAFSLTPEDIDRVCQEIILFFQKKR